MELKKACCDARVELAAELSDIFFLELELAYSEAKD